MTIARIIEYLYNIKKDVNAADYFSNVIEDTLFKGNKVENICKDRMRGVREVVKSVFAKKT